MERITNIINLRILQFLLAVIFFVSIINLAEFCLAEQEQSADILGSIAQKFSTKANDWASTLEQAALTIFKWCLIINIALSGLKNALDAATGRANFTSLIANFCMLIFFATFFYFTIQFYKEWSDQVIQGFLKLANSMGASKAVEGSFFQNGLALAGKTWDAVEVFSPKTWILLVTGIVLLICYALMAAQILLIKCEAYIVMNAGIFILGFGGLDYTRDYAINFMKYAFSVAVKLFVLQLLVSMSMSFVDDFITATIDLENISIVMGASIVMLALIRNIPDICAGIITGQHTSSGSGFIAAAAAVGGGVAAAAGGARSVGNTVDSGVGTAKTALAHGGSKMSALGQAAKTMAGAAAKSAFDGVTGNTQGGSFGQRMASNAEAGKMKFGIKKEEEKSQAASDNADVLQKMGHKS